MGVESFRNIFAIPDLRNRLLFMFGLLAVYRIGCIIPTPGIDPQALAEFMDQMQGTVLGFVNTFTGGSLGRVALFALGIMPYISASIILQLLTVVVPYLEKLSKEGEMGRRKITQYTRYGTVVISIIQGTSIAFFLENLTSPGGAPLVLNPGLGFKFVTVLSLTTGCAFVMWLGEQISERGIGNGISLIIFAGIVVGLPGAVLGLFGQLQSGAMSLIKILLLSVFMLVVVAFIVYMERAQRRIPVQYAKRIVGRRQYGGQSTYLPLRVNTGGVIPVIFASSVVTVPATVAGMIQYEPIQQIAAAMQWGQPVYYLLYVAAIIFFSLRLDHLQPERPRREHAEVRRVHPRHPLRPADFGVHRPGSDPPDPGRLAVPGGRVRPARVHDRGLQGRGHPLRRLDAGQLRAALVDGGMGINFYFGGTSLLIVVSVAMDTLQQIESQLVMRNYEGFMKRGRIRGRRG